MKLIPRIDLQAMAAKFVMQFIFTLFSCFSSRGDNKCILPLAFDTKYMTVKYFGFPCKSDVFLLIAEFGYM